MIIRKMKNEPLVSIIVPVYNVEKYLGKCVNSLCTQSFRNVEILLIDDGSTDESGRICDAFSEEDERIKVIHKKNGGLSDARNAGLQIASGEYITFVDSDDYVLKTYIEKLLIPFENDEVDITVCCPMAFFLDDSGKEIHSAAKRTNSGFELFSADMALEIMLRQTVFDTEACSKMYRSSLLEGFSFPVGINNEDLDSIYKLFLKARKVSVTREKLYCYLQRNDSIMGKNRCVKRYSDSFEIAERLRANIYECKQELTKAVNSRALSVYFQSYAGAIHCCDSELAEKSWTRIKELRAKVLADPYGRMKARAAAAVSFLGRKAFITAYDLIVKK